MNSIQWTPFYSIYQLPTDPKLQNNPENLRFSRKTCRDSPTDRTRDATIPIRVNSSSWNWLELKLELTGIGWNRNWNWLELELELTGIGIGRN